MELCESCDRQHLESHVLALERLIDVSRAVVSTLELETLLQAILDSAMKFAEMPAGSVALYDEKRGELTLSAHAGLTADFVRHERWEIKPGGLTEEVLKAGEIVFVEDTANASFFNNHIAITEGIRSLICLPLRVHEQAVGVLYLDDFVPRTFDREKMKLLSVLGSFAAMAIDNATLHNHTRVMAITDALTGLHNHRYFQQVFKKEMDRARRYEKPLSFIILDVDDFKKYNDRYGHFKGDQILVAVGDTIARTLRRVDHAFRYGGEEFVVLLPEAGLESALQVAERLRVGIAADTARLPDLKEGITVSVGVATYPLNGIERDDLFNTADSLLYRAKELGKNRVYFIRPNGQAECYTTDDV